MFAARERYVQCEQRLRPLQGAKNPRNPKPMSRRVGSIEKSQGWSCEELASPWSKHERAGIALAAQKP